MDTDALIEKDYLLQLKEGPISKFIKYYENIISDDEKSKLSAKEGKGIIIHVQGFSIVLDNNEIDEQDFNEYKEIYELVDDNYDGFDESKKPPKIPETPAVETTETPAPETPAPETPAVETTETPAPETTETPAPATMKKKKKPKKNKTQKKKGRKKNKKNKKNKKKKQRGGGGTHSKPSSDEEKSATDMFAKAFGFGPDIFNIQEESREAISNTEGQKTGEDGTSQPTARILADTGVDDNYYANKTLKEPSVRDFVPKYTERKPSSTSLATGLREDPFGLRQEGAPSLVVHDIPIGHAHFRALHDRANQKKTKREITELKSNTLKTCADLKAREGEIANLKEKTSNMSKNADDFAKAMEALKKQQQNQGCVVSGGKKSRRKKKKNKKKKNRKKSTRKKRRK